ncbi:hypothetical protein ACNO8S_13645 [Haloarcula sp. KBTZ06]|uniref:hypothetical protein n=1 Tax=Haloarcula sp. KBTZ06 TaxID=3402682 RepID=UPI003B43B26D
MKVIVDIPDELVDPIREAVQKGDYDSTREFVQFALENQTEIELNEKSAGQSLPALEDVIENRQSPHTAEKESEYTESMGDFGILRGQYSEIPTVDSPDENKISSGVLWGQYNRLLPIKFVIRGLANRVYTAKEPIPLAEFADSVADDARTFGQELQRLDEELGFSRGNKRSSAFPTGSDADKSLRRFKNHFIGEVSGDGSLRGAPFELALINVAEEDDRQRIAPTVAGREFAQLSNPILDSDRTAELPFSPEEREFYFNHLQEFRPNELEAMQYIATEIESGTDRPNPLTEAVGELNSDWSDNQASTIRTGLISRMNELGLLERGRVGQRGVKYSLTTEGETLLT